MTARLDYTTETAVEHLRNARQLVQGLQAEFRERQLTMIADAVDAIDQRIHRALVQIARGNIGRV